MTTPRARLGRLVRYGSVSVISTLTAMTVLAVLTGLLSFPATWSNVVATAIGTIPSFELNRRWVWSEAGRPRARQLVPFVALSMGGLVLSTLAVRMAAQLAGPGPRLLRTAVVEGASVGTFGLLWLVQFVLCDRVLFGHRETPVGHRETPPAPVGPQPTPGHAGQPNPADEPLVAASTGSW